jgi:hypothetical protein
MTNTVTIGVASREEINARFKRAMTTGKRVVPFIGFRDERALWGTLTPLRWEILKAKTGAGSLALREIARRVGRDVRGVHTDSGRQVCGTYRRAAIACLNPARIAHMPIILISLRYAHPAETMGASLVVKTWRIEAGMESDFHWEHQNFRRN